APAPVIAVRREEEVIGGAGNVARNLASLGARCIFISVVGKDAAGRTVSDAFAEFGTSIEPHLGVDASRPTTREGRFVSAHNSTHLMRADWEQAKPVAAEVEAALLERVRSALPRTTAVVISDYAKGVLTPRVIRTSIYEANRLQRPVVVDPKAMDFTV